MTPNPGFSAGIEKTSKVKRLAWAWKGAERKSKERRIKAMQAVVEGRMLLNECVEKIVDAGGNADEVGVLLVFAAASDQLSKVSDVVTFRADDPEADKADHVAVGNNLTNVPLGYLVCVHDDDDKPPITSVRPLVLDSEALALLSGMLPVTSPKRWKQVMTVAYWEK